MGVNHFWSIVFVTTVILVILFSFFLDKFMKKIKLFRLFEYSFNSNDALNSNILEIESDASIIPLEENPNLIFFSKTNNKIFYKLGIQNREELKKTVEQLKDNKNIKSIEIQYSN